MTASANNVTVPGDTRLNDLKVNRKAPFWAKIPIIKELRVAVGWQKGMLITGPGSTLIRAYLGYHRRWL